MLTTKCVTRATIVALVSLFMGLPLHADKIFRPFVASGTNGTFRTSADGFHEGSIFIGGTSANGTVDAFVCPEMSSAIAECGPAVFSYVAPTTELVKGGKYVGGAIVIRLSNNTAGVVTVKVVLK